MAITATTVSDRHVSNQVRAAVEAALTRIAAYEPVVGAWAHLDPDLARSRADELDKADGPGGAARRDPLHGLLVGVKDIIDTTDLPTERGSPLCVGRRPATDAWIVAALRDAGAVVLGKTVTTEFALYHPAGTRNPHDPARTPGGSSSGSAAAVAAGMAPLALGTQTAGSIVRPASFCGVWGFKPTYGTLATTGVLLVCETLDTLGFLAADVEVIAAAFAAISGAPTAPPVIAPPRIGLVRTPQWRAVDAGARERLERAAGQLAAAGAAVAAVGLPELQGLIEAQKTVMAVEAARNLGATVDGAGDRVSAALQGLVAEGRATPETAYAAALDRAADARGRLDARFAEYDVLLAPAVIGEAPVGLDNTGDPLFCRAWTLLGNPCLAVPGLRGPAGLPLGVQLVGARGDDAALLATGAWVGQQLADAIGPVDGTR